MNDLVEQLISENRAGLIVYLSLLLISHIAFGLFSCKYRFNKYIVYTLYALFSVCCIVTAKFYHNFIFLFIFVFLGLMILYVIVSKGNPFKSLFGITSYLIILSIFFGFTFLMMYIQGPYYLAIRWTLIVLFYILFELFIYVYWLPIFRKAEKTMTKGWIPLFIGDFLFLVIIFMRVFYPYRLDINDIGGVIFFLILVVFYISVFVFIINSFSTSALYGQEKEKNTKLQDLATHDVLTGLYNKNYLSNYKDELKNKKGLEMVVAIIDINKFKAINDTYGHIKGDEVLRDVAAKIKESFSKDYFKCFRFGGDEFVIISTKNNIEEMKEIMLLLKADILTNLNLTISSGFHTVDFNDIDPFETAIKNADKDMYQEKYNQ